MKNEQKFKRGDVVHIAADLGPCMSHFPADKDAIVMGSYRDEFGGNDVDSYSVLFCDTGGECAWYETHQLTLLRHGGEDEITRVKSERDAREKVETDLAWIVANWSSIRHKVPGATIGELMRRIGITNPWGAHGEGITYFTNARATFELLDPVLSAGNIDQVEAFFALANPMMSGPEDSAKTKPIRVHCERCGCDWCSAETAHADGIYCPRCPAHKDDHASLSVVFDA